MTGKLTSPDSSSHSTVANTDISVVTSTTDALKHTTAYGTDGYGRINKVTHAEGNYESYEYDDRGNVTKVTAVAKPGSGLANRIWTAGYDEGLCSLYSACNKPNYVIDALGNKTNYTYKLDTGQVTSITGPADPESGIRSQTRYTYEDRQAYFINTLNNTPNLSQGAFVNFGPSISVLTGVSTCRTKAGRGIEAADQGAFALMFGSAACAGSADELKTTINYWPPANVASNVLPLSQTTAAGDGSASVTTSQTYDAAGNVASETGPLGSEQTTLYYYTPFTSKPENSLGR